MLVFLSGANKLAMDLWLEESVAIPSNKGGVNWGERWQFNLAHGRLLWSPHLGERN